MNIPALPLGLALAAAWAAGALADEPIDTSVNLLENPSFEQHEPIRRDRASLFPAIPGWRSSLGHIEIHEGNSAGIGAFDARSKLDLDGRYNTDVFQDVATVAGRHYTLELFYAPQSTRHRTDTNDLRIEWKGEPIDRIGGDRRYWRRHLFDLQAGSDLSTLLLSGAGRSDRKGALIDALTLRPSAYASANLVENGSFEEPADFGHASRKLFTAIPGWRAARGAIEIIRHGTAGVLAYEGRTLLALDARQQDTVTQTLWLTPGTSYDLELFFSPERSAWADRIEVLVDGELLDGIDGRDPIWHRRRWSIVAPRAQVELTLRAPRAGRRHDDHDDHGTDNHREKGADGHRDDDDDHGDDDHDSDYDDNHDNHDGDDHDDHDHDHDRDDDDGNDANKGGLIDNVRVHQACRASDNLVMNHSFEAYGRLRDRDRGTFLTIPGWRAAQGLIEIHRYGGKNRSLMAAEGHSHLALGGDVAVEQDIATEPAARYELLFAYSPRTEAPGTNRNDVEVSWNGEVVKTVSGDAKRWQFHRVLVAASAGQTPLRFFAPNARHDAGGQIDEVRVFRLDVSAFDSEPVTEAAIGGSYSYAPRMSATASGPVSFALTGAPAGMGVDATSGRISWPDVVEGAYPLELVARNACGDVAVQRFTLVVTGHANRPPVIFSAPVTLAEIFTLRPVVSAIDANLESLTIELNGAPIASGARITQDGDYTLRVFAADRAGNSAEQVIQFSIDRSAAP